MPRNGSGTYTLPTGNPVVTGTTIESNWANTTLSDVATELTGSLARSGSGGMTGALRLTDGSQAVPALAFGNETGTGLYRAGTGEMWATVQGAQTLNLDATGVYVPADKTTTVDGAFVFNEAGADKDARFEGDTDANLLFTDASTDRVGVGTNTPTAKLNVEGSVIINDAGADVDVRIEGDTDANLLFTDASTDRVGVGTNAPASKLHVAGAIRSTGTDGSAAAATAVLDYAAGTTARIVSYGPDASTPGAIQFSGLSSNASAGDIRATISSGGDLGIGTTSPTFGSGTGVEIQRAGIATLRLENSTASNSFELYADSAANGINLRGRDSSPMLFWTGNTERARISSAGDVGIGTSSITTYSGFTTLDIDNATNGGLINVKKNGTTIGYINGSSGMLVLANSTDLKLTATGANTIQLSTNGSERARIHSTGGVSIGNTTDPGATNLSVSGTISDGTATLRPRVLATAVNSTSGTNIDFTGIPSWVKRITVMFSGVSTNGTSVQQIQLGDSGGFETTGYVGTGASNSTGASATIGNYTAGFALNNGSVAAQTQQGIATICLVGSNTWVFSFVGGRDNAVDVRGAGTKTLSDTLTQVRITTVNGTDTFDAGSINIMYE